MNMNNSYAVSVAERKQRAKDIKKLEAQRAERRKELERLVIEEQDRRNKRRRLASFA